MKLLINVVISILSCLYQLFININYIVKKDTLTSSFFVKLHELLENTLFELYSFICRYTPDSDDIS